jgi:hypothetical protein
VRRLKTASGATAVQIMHKRGRGARVIDHRVGLRPPRPHVWVEREKVYDSEVIHNYGHGGAGITLSWDCRETAWDSMA